MCNTNYHAAAIYTLVVLAGVVQCTGGGLILFDHLLATDPCEAYTADDCDLYACQEYSSGCPCNIVTGNCHFLDNATHPIMPKACKRLPGVDGTFIYNIGLFFAYIIAIEALIVIAQGVIGIISCLTTGSSKPEGAAFGLVLVNIFFSGFASSSILLARTDGLNTCYRDDFNFDSEARKESDEFRAKFWIIIISGISCLVFNIWFIILYVADVCKNGSDNHLFQAKYQEVAPEDPDFINVDKILIGGQRKKIVYKF